MSLGKSKEGRSGFLEYTAAPSKAEKPCFDMCPEAIVIKPMPLGFPQSLLETKPRELATEAPGKRRAHLLDGVEALACSWRQQNNREMTNDL